TRRPGRASAMLDESRREHGGPTLKRWTVHARHTQGGMAPHSALVADTPTPDPGTRKARAMDRTRPITIDGSPGEGGGQVLRTALSLSLLTGRPFRMIKVRANREKPGLRPQHLMAVEAASALGGEAEGAVVGARELRFRPIEVVPRDLTFDIGTAGATSLVL